MALQIITALVQTFEAAISAAEERYWAEREAEFDDYSDYYHSAYPEF